MLTQTCAHTQTQTHTHIHTPTNTHAGTHSNRHIHKHTHRQTHTQTNTHTHTHTHRHALMRVRTHTQTNTHINTHNLAYSLCCTHSHLVTLTPSHPPWHLTLAKHVLALASILHVETHKTYYVLVVLTNFSFFNAVFILFILQAKTRLSWRLSFLKAQPHNTLVGLPTYRPVCVS